jgi:hypothetical protein
MMDADEEEDDEDQIASDLNPEEGVFLVLLPSL